MKALTPEEFAETLIDQVSCGTVLCENTEAGFLQCAVHRKLYQEMKPKWVEAIRERDLQLLEPQPVAQPIERSPEPGEWTEELGQAIQEANLRLNSKAAFERAYQRVREARRILGLEEDDDSTG
jgi:hypothetical protein